MVGVRSELDATVAVVVDNIIADGVVVGLVMEQDAVIGVAIGSVVSDNVIGAGNEVDANIVI